MKSVLISIQPKWCELIASGRKTIEVRKSIPKIGEAFKCYIYCTKGTFDITACPDLNADTVKVVSNDRGKVIGEFICGGYDTYGAKLNRYRDIEFCITEEQLEKACLSYEQFYDYAKIARPQEEYTTFYGELYGWHISDLKIYDKPKELSEFRHCANRELPCAICKSSDNYISCGEKVKRPPQSYFYVERLK